MAPRAIGRPILRISAYSLPHRSTVFPIQSITSRALHNGARPSIALANPRILSLSPRLANCNGMLENRLIATPTLIRHYATIKREHLPTGKDVSSDSTTHSITKEVGQKGKGPVLAPAPDVDMTKAIKSDFKVIRETFALSAVPREAYVLGLAGTIPYLATSLTTLFCAWDLNYAAHNHEGGYIISPETAFQIINILEPIQVGWGAVILSFLGAIHWGFEWSGYGGYHSYRRYAIGVVAPAFAWSTIMLPYEWALAGQFLGFTMLYFVDSTVTTRGWTPPWYSTYRFVLTFIVGASIVVSLIGRGEIGDQEAKRKLPGAVDRIKGEGRGEDKRARYEGERAKILDKKQKEEKKKQKEEEKKQKEEEEKAAKEKKDKGEDDESDEGDEGDENDDKDSKEGKEDKADDKDKKDEKK